MALRPTTNLRIDRELMLNPSDNKRGFLYLYNKAYRGSGARFWARVWGIMIAPDIVNHNKFGTSPAACRAAAKNIANFLPSGFLRVEKVDVAGAEGGNPHFQVDLPLVALRVDRWSEQIGTFLLPFFGKTAPDDVIGMLGGTENHHYLKDRLGDEEPGTYIHDYSMEEVLDALKLDAEGDQAFSETLTGVSMESAGNHVIVYANLTIESYEAEQMTSTKWAQIRNIDMYPLLQQWIRSAYERAPVAGLPVSKIAETLPKSMDGLIPRINEHGLAIDEVGRPHWLPKTLDDTREYEQAYADAGTRTYDGGTYFCLLRPKDLATEDQVTAQAMLKVKLPKNRPVLIDWLNSKYTYTLGSGRLHVDDISRWRPMTSTHALTIMHRTYLPDELVEGMQKLASVLGAPPLKVIASDFQDGAMPGVTNDMLPVVQDNLSQLSPEPLKYYATAMRLFKQVTGREATLEVLSATSPYGPFRAFGRWLLTLQKTIEANPLAAYQHRTVSGMMLLMPYIMMPNLYGGANLQLHLDAVKAENDVYTSQGVDPNWKDEPLPLLGKKFGRLPHQHKVANLLRSNPPMALLRVAAGGGKTPIIITDVLSFIKRGASAPYLIMCPSHLVAQYVNEINYFTDGQLNCIPINTYTMGLNSFDRISKMIASAPRNTVVVADYDCLRVQSEEMMYGTAPVTIYPYMEVLMQFGFQYVALDEVHYLRNDSQRSAAVGRLVLDIPVKRLASGTMAHDSATDLAQIMSIIDPTLFGTKSEFNAKFGEHISGDRVIKWKPGAEARIMAEIKTRVVDVQCQRKEWAGILPFFASRVFPVEMTTEQSRVYQEVLDRVIQDIEKAASKPNAPKALKKFVAGQQGVGADGEKLTTSEDDEEAESLEGLLNPYIARLEQFLAAPGSDKWGSRQLEGKDAVSPVVDVIVDIVREHERRMHLPKPANAVVERGKGREEFQRALDPNTPVSGKILIFVSYVESGTSIYENLPADLKGKFIHYYAETKTEDIARFEKDDNIIGLIGVEASLNTGLNLQCASRVIKVESVWNPGTLEQGNARVGRPELKREDARRYVFYDFIVVDKSIAVTKIARLISKTLSVAKLENPNDPAYQGFEDLPVVPMTLDSIRNLNSINPRPKESNEPSEYDDPNTPGHTRGLKDYLVNYSSYLDLQRDEFDEYREKHGVPKLQHVEAAPTPKDAAIMREVPYTAGLDVYASEELGLIRLDHYLREDALEDLSNAYDDVEEMSEDDKLQSLKGLLKDSPVHTEFGDGYILRLNRNTVSVMLPDQGYSVALRKTAVFLITRPTVKSETIRVAMAKRAGLPVTKDVVLPLPLTFRPATPGQRKANESEVIEEVQEDDAKLQAELHITVTNGFLGISYTPSEDDDSGVSKALNALGFRMSAPHYYAPIKNYKALLAQFQLWRDKKFTLANNDEASPAFQALYQMLQRGMVKKHSEFYQFAKSVALVNFYRMQIKPNNDKKSIRPYPLVEDGVAYIALPSRGQTGTMQAIKYRAPGIIFHLAAEHWTCFTGTPARTSAMIKKIAQHVEITNLDELRKEAAALKTAKFRPMDPEA